LSNFFIFAKEYVRSASQFESVGDKDKKTKNQLSLEINILQVAETPDITECFQNLLTLYQTDPDLALFPTVLHL
jgi:hypothetical protein